MVKIVESCVVLIKLLAKKYYINKKIKSAVPFYQKRIKAISKCQINTCTVFLYVLISDTNEFLKTEIYPSSYACCF